MSLVKVGSLTRGERLLLVRRRRGNNQYQEAERRGTSRYRYRRWELDADDPPFEPGVGPVLDHERCFLARRRAGVSSAALAKVLDVSKWWLRMMESGRAPLRALQEHWGS